MIGVLEDGTNLYRWEMDAFGNREGGSGNTFLPMNHPGPKEHLTGKLYDTTTGLYYFHARWYDPLTGRFVSRDPVWKAVSYYSICDSNPVLYVDPNGQQMIHPMPPNAKDCRVLEGFAGCCQIPRDLEGMITLNMQLIEELRRGTPIKEAYRIIKGSDWETDRIVGIGECYDHDTNGVIDECDVWFIPSGNPCLDQCRCKVDQVASQCILMNRRSLPASECEARGLEAWIECIINWFGIINNDKL